MCPVLKRKQFFFSAAGKKWEIRKAKEPDFLCFFFSATGAKITRKYRKNLMIFKRPQKFAFENNPHRPIENPWNGEKSAHIETLKLKKPIYTIYSDIRFVSHLFLFKKNYIPIMRRNKKNFFWIHIKMLEKFFENDCTYMKKII